MQRIQILFTMIIFAFLLASCQIDRELEQKKTIRIGITVYDQYDTFVKELMECFMEQVHLMEEETDMTITVMRESADGSQEAQNNQVESFIESGCDVLCVNLVDRMDASVIMDKAEAAGLPVIYFNRELVAEDLTRNDKLYYVGADALESGIMQGEIILQLINEAPEKHDKNGDGIYQYVMLEGEPAHQDTVVRTEYAVKTVLAGGVRLERLEDEIANWVRSQAETKMVQWLEVHSNAIEIVFANNDDMALGAIDALKLKKIPKEEWPLIVGIDGTAPGLEAVVQGEMSGTVFNDAVGQAKELINLCYALSTGSKLPPMRDGRYIRLPYQKVTTENIADYYLPNQQNLFDN